MVPIGWDRFRRLFPFRTAPKESTCFIEESFCAIRHVNNLKIGVVHRRVGLELVAGKFYRPKLFRAITTAVEPYKHQHCAHKHHGSLKRQRVFRHHKAEEQDLKGSTDHNAQTEVSEGMA